MLFLCLITTWSAVAQRAKETKKFVILIASYNNEKYVKKNILSAIQDYPDEYYRIIYIDDCSTDATCQKAQKIIAESGKSHLFTLIHNETNKGALYNHWSTIHNLIEDDEIVVILDGDDRLAGDFVLNYLNDIYTKNDIWLTYGQYQEINSQQIGFNKPMPEYVVKNNAFRRYQDIPSHLRTFYAKLYKNIKIEDLMLDDDFLIMCADMATGIPMIEQACDHFQFIPKVLYLYNDRNPISDHFKSRKLQIDIDHYVRSRQVYKPLETLF
jgi:glycosyltransferase involved in cell wall biosynthesis